MMMILCRAAKQARSVAHRFERANPILLSLRIIKRSAASQIRFQTGIDFANESRSLSSGAANVVEHNNLAVICLRQVWWLPLTQALGSSRVAMSMCLRWRNQGSSNDPARSRHDDAKGISCSSAVPCRGRKQKGIERLGFSLVFHGLAWTVWRRRCRC
jgi:hypothetical protein